MAFVILLILELSLPVPILCGLSRLLPRLGRLTESRGQATELEAIPYAMYVGGVSPPFYHLNNLRECEFETDSVVVK